MLRHSRVAFDSHQMHLTPNAETAEQKIQHHLAYSSYDRLCKGTLVQTAETAVLSA